MKYTYILLLLIVLSNTVVCSAHHGNQLIVIQKQADAMAQAFIAEDYQTFAKYTRVSPDVAHPGL